MQFGANGVHVPRNLQGKRSPQQILLGASELEEPLHLDQPRLVLLPRNYLGRLTHLLCSKTSLAPLAAAHNRVSKVSNTSEMKPA